MADQDDPVGEVVTCQVCGDQVGRGPSGLGVIAHANRHRREYENQTGEWPDTYQDVRDRLGVQRLASTDDEQLTLLEAVDQRARDARHDDGQGVLPGVDDGE